MYLSGLQLNDHNRQIWRNVIDQPYKLHQIVMSGFPDGITPAIRPFFSVRTFNP